MRPGEGFQTSDERVVGLPVTLSGEVGRVWMMNHGICHLRMLRDVGDISVEGNSIVFCLLDALMWSRIMDIILKSNLHQVR